MSLRLGHGIPGTGHPPDTRVPQLWKENKADRRRSGILHTHHTSPMRGIKTGEGYACIKLEIPS